MVGRYGFRRSTKSSQVEKGVGTLMMGRVSGGALEGRAHLRGCSERVPSCPIPPIFLFRCQVGPYEAHRRNPCGAMRQNEVVDDDKVPLGIQLPARVGGKRVAYFALMGVLWTGKSARLPRQNGAFLDWGTVCAGRAPSAARAARRGAGATRLRQYRRRSGGTSQHLA